MVVCIIRILLGKELKSMENKFIAGTAVAKPHVIMWVNRKTSQEFCGVITYLDKLCFCALVFVLDGF